MALIDKQPRSAMARATVETTVKEIDQNALLGYLKNSPQTAFNMMQQLASYARNANEKLSVDAFESGNENENTKYMIIVILAIPQRYKCHFSLAGKHFICLTFSKSDTPLSSLSFLFSSILEGELSFFSSALIL